MYISYNYLWVNFNKTSGDEEESKYVLPSPQFENWLENLFIFIDINKRFIDQNKHKLHVILWHYGVSDQQRENTNRFILNYMHEKRLNQLYIFEIFKFKRLDTISEIKDRVLPFDDPCDLVESTMGGVLNYFKIDLIKNMLAYDFFTNMSTSKDDVFIFSDIQIDSKFKIDIFLDIARQIHNIEYFSILYAYSPMNSTNSSIENAFFIMINNPAHLSFFKRIAIETPLMLYDKILSKRHDEDALEVLDEVVFSFVSIYFNAIYLSKNAHVFCQYPEESLKLGGGDNYIGMFQDRMGKIIERASAITGDILIDIITSPSIFNLNNDYFYKMEYFTAIKVCMRKSHFTTNIHFKELYVDRE